MNPNVARPTSALVFGILNIVFGAFSVCGIFGLVAMLAGIVKQPPISADLVEAPIYKAWIVLSLLISIVMTPLLIISGIGLIRLQEWARKLSLFYAIFNIIFVVIATIVQTFIFTLPVIQRASADGGPEAAGAMGGAIGGAIGGLCGGMIYPIFLVIFMRRRVLIDAIRAAAESDGMWPGAQV